MDLMRWERPAPKDLWDAFESFRGELDRAFDSVSVPYASGLLDKTIAPAIDVVETAEEYVIVADVPGVAKKDLEISLTGSVLTVKGEKKAETGSEKRKIFRKETWIGSFCRSIDLPRDIDPQGIKAELKDGVLAIRIPKREEAKPRRISVDVK